MAVALVVAAAALPACGGRSAPQRPAAVGSEAPPFRLPNVRESEPDVSLASFSGRPVVINFWASWCRPCTEEMPAFEAVHRRMGEQVAFVGIDRQDDRGDALRFLTRTGVTYPSGYDPQGKLDAAYRLRGTPTTVVVAADGRVTEQITGPVTASRLDQMLSGLRRG